MEKTNILSDGRDTLKETTHGNLKKTYKMQAKSYRSTLRVYQKQDNFSTELELRGGVMSQTSFSHNSTNTCTIPTAQDASESPQKDLSNDAQNVSK